jgi:hydrogenase nickel incorporation protein HypB
MCDVCGCDTRVKRVDVHEGMLSANDRVARHNREHFLRSGVLAINVMGSPGSGKTALLEATAKALPSRKLGALNGDLATDHDARRLSAAGIAAATITTGTVCHLDAEMVHNGLHQLEEASFEVLFLENVGNLVCPAVYDLGQDANVVLLSVTEGYDKPLKYPVMFRRADLVVLTKIDLLPYVDVSQAAIEDALARVMPKPALMPLSTRTGEGMERWIAWLDTRIQQGGRGAERTTELATASASQRDQASER